MVLHIYPHRYPLPSPYPPSTYCKQVPCEIMSHGASHFATHGLLSGSFESEARRLEAVFCVLHSSTGLSRRTHKGSRKRDRVMKGQAQPPRNLSCSARFLDDERAVSSSVVTSHERRQGVFSSWWLCVRGNRPNRSSLLIRLLCYCFVAKLLKVTSHRKPLL